MKSQTVGKTETGRLATAPQQFTPLELETRPTVDTAAAAHYLHLAEQTLRIFACKETGCIRPRRIPGSAKLHWDTADLRRLLGVTPLQNGFVTIGAMISLALLAWLASLTGIVNFVDLASIGMLGAGMKPAPCPSCGGRDCGATESQLPRPPLHSKGDCLATTALHEPAGFASFTWGTPDQQPFATPNSGDNPFVAMESATECRVPTPVTVLIAAGTSVATARHALKEIRRNLRRFHSLDAWTPARHVDPDDMNADIQF